MKTIINLILAITLLSGISYANSLSCKLSLANINFTSERTLEFDIILYNTSQDKADINYAAGQYFIDFNSEIANNGNLTYSIISSGLPELLRPNNPTVYENQLRLAVNQLNSDKNLVPVIHYGDNGLLIARMKLETSSGKFAGKEINLKWSNAGDKFRTKVAAFVNSSIEQITISQDNINGADNSKNNITLNSAETPKEFSVAQNYPNPFNPVTKINFGIPVSGFVTLKVYDITGRMIATLVSENLNPGSYHAVFNGADFASGMYFYKIQAGSFTEIRKMLLIK